MESVDVDVDVDVDVEPEPVASEKILQEGKAKIVVDNKKKHIFYNPVQEFNRDLSIAVLSQYSWARGQESAAEVPKPGLRILEALAASGLRSIRYAKEVPAVAEILANDIASQAVEAIRRNVELNQVEELVRPCHGDATMLMYDNRKTPFDVVDLDPYGCPAIFLDGAVQCLANNGLLLVTATDMAVLAGNFPETCYVKYGALSLKTKACHEMGLRILLQSIASHASRYGRCIEPLLAVSVDFYIRVFVKIYSSKIACKQNTSKLGMVYQCTGCESLTVQPLGITTDKNVRKLPQVPVVDKSCQFCAHRHHMGGPIWTGPLHNKDFVHQILTQIDSEEDNNLKSLNTVRRMRGILHMIYEELEVPLYYQLDRLASIVKINVPPMVKFRSALLNAGYKVSYSHANKNSIKTNASNQVIWDIIRAWENEPCVEHGNADKNSAAIAIRNGISMTEVSFAKHEEAVPFSQQNKLRRFQVNPTAYWGPGTKSTIMMSQDDKTISKKEKNQSKKRKIQQLLMQELNEDKEALHLDEEY